MKWNKILSLALAAAMALSAAACGGPERVRLVRRLQPGGRIFGAGFL